MKKIGSASVKPLCDISMYFKENVFPKTPICTCIYGERERERARERERERERERDQLI